MQSKAKDRDWGAGRQKFLAGAHEEEGGVKRKEDVLATYTHPAHECEHYML